ncbi:hypothetical protein SPSIL_051850 [Sporomusa silvacetica DSM 10669]|uniref:HTH merR-type domain-containing protein n=1 Tax=Sporomusa silvacetica DSM 10669 TaxID=1123289 RepID=A0ABZ3ITF6_9FIRM|nr:HTH-type transcriptional regulator ZntR [Sporomusa silvacetica DSM 10669]
MVKYKIGEVSHLLGIPIDTIRYYETKEIVNPDKNKESGYRYYDAWDINYLLDCKYWRSFDFSLSDVRGIINECSYEDICEKLLEQEAKLTKVAAHYQKLVKRTADYRLQLQRIKKFLWQCGLENSPDIVCCNLRANYIFDKSLEVKKLTKKYLELFPFTRPYLEIPQHAIINRLTSNEHVWGFFLTAGDAREFGIKIEPPVKYIPAKRSVYTIIAAGSKGTFTLKMLNHVNDYMDQHGYELDGDAIGSILARVHKGGEYVRYMEIWVPIK